MVAPFALRLGPDHMNKDRVRNLFSHHPKLGGNGEVSAGGRDRQLSSCFCFVLGLSRMVSVLSSSH
jgi:hypothetical protein